MLALLFAVGLTLSACDDYAGSPSSESSTSEDPVGGNTSTSEDEPASDTSAEEPATDEPSSGGTTCEDVTSIDYNWKNDMKCTRSDGSVFYTDYAGARRAEQGADIQGEGSAPAEEQPQAPAKTTCVDVTSYDHNWNNDMLCTRPDGSTFYTNYEGARRAEQG